jgi:hypothetical protein
LLLIGQINKNEFIQNLDQCIEIFRSCQHWNINLYPLTNIFSIELADYIPLIRFISWIDKNEVKSAIESLAKKLELSTFSVDKSILFLQDSYISHMFWLHLGREKYANLLISLENTLIENASTLRVETLATLQISDILACFSDLKELLKKESFNGYFLTDSDIEGRVWSDYSQDAINQLEISCQNSLEHIDGWESCKDSMFYSKQLYSPGERHVLIFIVSFIEIYHNLNVDENSKIMMVFAHKKQVFSYIRTSLGEDVISICFNYVLGTELLVGTILYDAIKKLKILDQELAMEDLDFY